MQQTQRNHILLHYCIVIIHVFLEEMIILIVSFFYMGHLKIMGVWKCSNTIIPVDKIWRRPDHVNRKSSRNTHTKTIRPVVYAISDIWRWSDRATRTISRNTHTKTIRRVIYAIAITITFVFRANKTIRWVGKVWGWRDNAAKTIAGNIDTTTIGRVVYAIAIAIAITITWVW